MKERSAFFQIARRNMNMGRRIRITDGREFHSRHDQQGPANNTDNQRRKDMQQAARLWWLLLGAGKVGHRRKEQHGRNAGANGRFGKGHINRIEVHEHRRRDKRIGSGKNHHGKQLTRPDHQHEDEHQKRQKQDVGQHACHQPSPPFWFLSSFTTGFRPARKATCATACVAMGLVKNRKIPTSASFTLIRVKPS